MISAIGVSYLIQNLAFYITGGVPQPVSNPIPVDFRQRHHSGHAPPSG